MTKKYILVFLITAIVFFVFGYISETIIYNKSCSSVPVDPNNTYQAGWQAAQKRLQDSGTFQIIDQKTLIMEIVGNVVEIKSDSLLVKIIPIEPLADSNLDIREIELNSQTLIKKIIKKDEQQYLKELNEFNDKHGDDYYGRPDATITPPNAYTETEISLAEVIIGEQVVIKTQENIRDVKKFTANEIIVQY